MRQTKAVLLLPCLTMAPAAATLGGPGSIAWQVPATSVSSVAAPDSAGGFVLRVMTAGTLVRASHCSKPGAVELQMADTMPSGAAIALNAAQRANVRRKIAFYRQIMTSRHDITFHLAANRRYLYRRGSDLVMPYCVASLGWTP